MIQVLGTLHSVPERVEISSVRGFPSCGKRKSVVSSACCACRAAVGIFSCWFLYFDAFPGTEFNILICS